MISHLYIHIYVYIYIIFSLLNTGPNEYFYKQNYCHHYSQYNTANQIQNNPLLHINQEHIGRTTNDDHDNSVFDELIQSSRHVFH